MHESNERVKEHPILMTADMVRAILNGQKTQTRRPVHPQPESDETAQWSFCVDSTARKSVDKWTCAVMDDAGSIHSLRGRERAVAHMRCPFGNAGDRLWVRETWAVNASFDSLPPSMLPIRGMPVLYHATAQCTDYRWRPSIHMPRWASRITLEITDVRVRLVQNITDEDAVMEGIQKSTGGMWCGSPHKAHSFPRQHNTPKEAFADLWDSIYAKPGLGWDANPWVWAVTFTKLSVTGKPFVATAGGMTDETQPEEERL